MKILSVALALLLVLGFLLIPAAAMAADVHCAYHPFAICHGTGQTRWIAQTPYEKYSCSCGDIVWVKQ
ncbi:MAG: hypothetical protein WBW54_10405 [Candidatus Acidiferrales bacterium]